MTYKGIHCCLKILLFCSLHNAHITHITYVLHVLKRTIVPVGGQNLIWVWDVDMDWKIGWSRVGLESVRDESIYPIKRGTGRVSTEKLVNCYRIGRFCEEISDFAIYFDRDVQFLLSGRGDQLTPWRKNSDTGTVI
jgi:hypothetical protein